MNSYDLAGGEPFELFRSEVDALKQLCGSLPWQAVIIQIGAGPGCSTLAMLEERQAAFILSIDTMECKQEKSNIIAGGRDYRRVVRALGTSQEIGIAWPWPCDMLYIDGDHQRPGIDADILLWTPHVRAGGVIAFHDCYQPGTKPAHIYSKVYEAVEEWLEKEPHKEILWTERIRAFRK